MEVNEIIYPYGNLKDNTVFMATVNTRVFVTKRYDSTIPEGKRINRSYKGSYYIILANERITYLRQNMWDRCYFALSNGAEFMIECGNPETYLKRNKFIKCN